MFHAVWPATAFVTLFLVVGVIIILLRFGPRICKTRHHTFPDESEWVQKTYNQNVGFESFA